MRVLVSVVVPLRLRVTFPLMLGTPLQPDDTWRKCLEMRCCMDVWSVVAWTFAEYSRRDQLLPTLVFSSRFQLLDGLYVERSETMVDNAWVVRAFSSPIAFRRHALQLRQGARHSRRLSVNKMLHIMF